MPHSFTTGMIVSDTMMFSVDGKYCLLMVFDFQVAFGIGNRLPENEQSGFLRNQNYSTGSGNSTGAADLPFLCSSGATMPSEITYFNASSTLMAKGRMSCLRTKM